MDGNALARLRVADFIPVFHSAAHELDAAVDESGRVRREMWGISSQWPLPCDTAPA
jgi:hypothetical protein